MARPRSEHKRQLILQAAVKLFAEEGLNASTLRIAKQAAVAEGTIFTYFESKEELLNQLYLYLKSQLRLSLALCEQTDTLQEQIWIAWQAYVNRGISHPEEHEVLAKLTLSASLTDATRAEGNSAFCDVLALLETAKKSGVLSNQPTEFVGAMMGAMGDVTMSFMRAAPLSADKICIDGFNAFWRAIATA